MIGEREQLVRHAANGGAAVGAAGAAALTGLVGARALALHDRRAPVKPRSPREATSVYPSDAARPPVSPLLLFVLLIAGEGLSIIACNVLLAVWGPGEFPSRILVEAAIAGVGIALLFAVIRPMIRFRGASARASIMPGLSLSGTLAALAFAELAALGAYAYLAHYFGMTIPPVSFHNWLHAWVLATAVVGLLDIAGTRLAARWHSEGRMARRIVVYGGGEHGARFITEVAARLPRRLFVRGFFDDRADSMRAGIAGVPWLGDSHHLSEFVRTEHVDEIVIALPWSAEQRILEILRRFRHLPVPVRLAPDLIALSTAEAAQEAAFATLIIRDRPVSEWGLLVKDLFDRVIACLVLLLVLPTMGALACLIKLDSPGPIFFRQPRLGFNNRPFNILKFRTMAVAPPGAEGLRQARRGDRRVTRIGRFLRRSSLDELPQLFNVLRGEMSLVGPRPHPLWSKAGELWPSEGERPLDAVFSEYASRHRMKPGITGWAQVCGYRGETETVGKMAKRVEHDLYYIDNWSLWLDLRILARTLVAAFVDHNAY
jgi:Undecaprenyl-phosphate glucose phosphotransferase